MIKLPQLNQDPLKLITQKRYIFTYTLPYLLNQKIALLP